MSLNNNSVNIVVFASGSGSNFKSIHQKITDGEINGNIKLVVSNNLKSGALKYAISEGIPIFIHNKVRYPNELKYYESLSNELKKANANLLVLAGFMNKIPDAIVTQFERRILNIHPALLPKFGGKGYFGMNVHRAVLEAKEKESGTSIHFVNKIYDNGPIVAQSKVNIFDNDSPEDLAKRILIEEHKLYPEVVKAFCEDRIVWEDNKPIILRNI